MNDFRQQLQARWTTLAPRERRMVALALGLVALALLWWVALAPALATLASARTEHPRLDAQLQHMRGLQAQAQLLQSQPRANHSDAVRALETAVREGLGDKAQFATSGDGANVALRQVGPEQLAQWLAQARSNARALPREAHLTRAATAATAATTAAPRAGRAAATAPPLPIPPAADAVRWDGTLVMALPEAR